MIVVKLTGGLGNQMFQYAFGRYLADRHHTTLKLDTSYFEEFSLRKFELDVFVLQKQFISKEDVNRYFNPVKLFGKIRKKTGNYKIIAETAFEYTPALIDKSSSNSYVIGYWQSEKYFSEVSMEIRNAFKFRHQPDKYNGALMEQMKKTNSVSIHVRRGDFITDSKTNLVHGSCSIEYFERAISFMQTKMEALVFYIFSDDLKWVMANLSIPSTHYFMDHNNQDYEDMRLMSACNHNILSNSSFSWWAAWLNSNEKKIVVAPEKWFNDTHKNTRDLIPESWVKM